MPVFSFRPGDPFVPLLPLLFHVTGEALLWLSATLQHWYVQGCMEKKLLAHSPPLRQVATSDFLYADAFYPLGLERNSITVFFADFLSGLPVHC